MACIYRLVILLLPLLFWSPVNAAFPASAVPPTCTSNCLSYQPTQALGNTLGPWFNTNAEACAWGVSNVGLVNYSATLVTCGTTSYTYSFKYTTGSPSGTESKPIATKARSPDVTTYSCPANATLSGSSCTCNANFTESGSACVSAAQAVCDAMNATGSTYRAGTSLSTTACSAGVTVQGTMSAMANGSNYIYPPFTCTASNCVPSTTAGSVPPTADSAASDPKCVKPQVGGTVTVNGVTSVVCYTPTATTTPPTSTAAPTPAGSASAPTSGLGSDAPPTATGSTKQTTCTAGTCTTTTTYTNGSGATVGTKTTNQPQASFCAENAGSPICVNSTISGSCSTTSCTGDAIQCAIAKEINRRNCELFDTSGSDQVKLYNESLANADKDKSGYALGAPVVKAFKDQISTENALGVAASCITDKQVSVMGASVTIPFSQVCPWLDILGNALVAVGMVAAAVIVFRG